MGRRTMSKLVSGTAKLMLGRGGAVVIGVVAAPVISRLFTPEDFGIVGTVNSVSNWAVAFSCLGYAMAIPLSRSRAETGTLVILCLLITLGLLVPAILLPILCGGAAADFLEQPALSTLLWFVPLVFLAACLGQIAHLTCSKEGRFGLSSLSQFGTAGAGHGAKIALGYLMGGGALYLLLGTFIGSMMGLLIAAPAVLSVLLYRSEGDEAPACTLAGAAKRHSQFPKIQVWSSVLNVTSQSLPVLLLARFFGKAVVGYYTFSMVSIMLPLGLVGGSIRQVFYPEGAAEWRETGSISKTIDKAVDIVRLTCIVPIVAIAMLGPLLFETVFGSQWYEAGVYSQILAPWMLMGLIVSPISTVFLVRQRAGVLFLYNIVVLISRPGALALGWWLGGPRTALACFSAVGTLVYIHQLIVIMRLAKAGMHGTIALFREALRAVPLMLPAAVGYWVWDSQWISLCMLAAGVALHLGLIYRREPLVRDGLSGLLSRFRRAESPRDGEA